MKGKPKRPLRGLALLGAASVAVVAAAAVWLQVGWKSLGLKITDTIGDGAQELQGFTLEGAIEWNGSFDSLYFRLEDGTLQTSFWLDKHLPEVRDLNYWPEMVVPKSERAPAKPLSHSKSTPKHRSYAPIPPPCSAPTPIPCPTIPPCAWREKPSRCRRKCPSPP